MLNCSYSPGHNALFLSLAGSFSVITIVIEGCGWSFLTIFVFRYLIIIFLHFCSMQCISTSNLVWFWQEESMWLGQLKRIIIMPFIVGRTNHGLNGKPACNEWHLYIVPIWRNKLPHTDQLLLMPSVDVWARVYVGERLKCYNKSRLNKQDFDHNSDLLIIHAFTSLPFFFTDPLVSTLDNILWTLCNIV